MRGKKGKSKRKAVKYKTIVFKVTAGQKKSLLNFCRSRRTTPNKMIKKVLRPLLTNYSELEVNTHHVSVKQLQLFE